MNMMQLIGMIKKSNNPNAMIAQMMRQSNSPMASNAAQMIEKGDMKGVETIARNMCNSKGINPDDVYNNVRNMFGV